MVAEHLTSSRLPLLMEPAAPCIKAPHALGWRLAPKPDKTGRRPYVRDHTHDITGALVQHAIVRYLVHGASRAQLAREAGYSERQMQAFLLGRAWKLYARPVLDALKALGITAKRGQRMMTGTGRLTEIIGAQMEVLERADGLLAYMRTPEAGEVRSLIRLLLAGREPLGGAP